MFSNSIGTGRTARLAHAGTQPFSVRFLSINPNRTFYERLGAHFLREQLYDWIGVILPKAV
jgi:hypothetical protein